MIKKRNMNLKRCYVVALLSYIMENVYTTPIMDTEKFERRRSVEPSQRDHSTTHCIPLATGRGTTFRKRSC